MKSCNFAISWVIFKAFSLSSGFALSKKESLFLRSSFLTLLWGFQRAPFQPLVEIMLLNLLYTFWELRDSWVQYEIIIIKIKIISIPWTLFCVLGRHCSKGVYLFNHRHKFIVRTSWFLSFSNEGTETKAGKDTQICMSRFYWK